MAKANLDLSELEVPVRSGTRPTFLAAMSEEQRELLFAVRRKWQAGKVALNYYQLRKWLQADERGKGAVRVAVTTLKGFLNDDGTLYKEVGDGQEGTPKRRKAG